MYQFNKLKQFDSPCHGCGGRHNLCHSTCIKYAEYRERIWETKGRYSEYKRIGQALGELDHHRATTRKRNKGGTR